jgi:hypothetical protein
LPHLRTRARCCGMVRAGATRTLMEPAGGLRTGMVPAGVTPSGTAPAGGAPTGTAPAGVTPNGMELAGAAHPGMAPAGAMAPGTSRGHVDRVASDPDNFARTTGRERALATTVGLPDNSFDLVRARLVLLHQREPPAHLGDDPPCPDRWLAKLLTLDRVAGVQVARQPPPHREGAKTRTTTGRFPDMRFRWSQFRASW